MKTKRICARHRLAAFGRGVRRMAAPLLAASLAAGCAATRIEAQWTDPQWPRQSLQGTTVLVVCDAQDTTLKLVCESRFAARLAALGVKPVTAPAGASPGMPPASQDVLSAARTAGAASVLRTTMQPDYSAVGRGPTFSFGIGGYGGSGGGGGGGGVGVAVPVGASGAAGMAASSTLADAAGSGQVVWSARAIAQASSDASAQIDELAAVLAGALKQAGLL